MIQKAKILGIALVAVMTQGAVTSTSASATGAHHFTSKESGTVTATGLTRFDFKPETAGNISNGCNAVSMKGEIQSTQDFLALPSLTLSPDPPVTA